MREMLRRMLPVWKQTYSLSWPVAVQQTFVTLMRTTDVLVTGLFSPAAVAAIGLAGLYAQVPLRIGQGLGSGAIALTSQDTGRGAMAGRNRVTTQALLMGAIAGLPLIVVGVLLSHALIAVLGAEADVVRLGGLYLMIIFLVAPLRIVSLIGAQALQGVGNTRTPMILTGVANVVNILATIGLGLGVGPLPRLGIIGVGLGTAIGRSIEAVTILATFLIDRTDLWLARPRDLTVTKQILGVSIPNFAEGMSSSIANFPFNAMLLLFGTEVVAGYHIGRRVYQQFTGPLYRAYRVAASVTVGQALGRDEPAVARFSGTSITVLSVLTVGLAGIALAVFASPIADWFTNDATTLGHAADFTRLFGLSMVFFAVYFTMAGNLRGAGDTRTPLYARLSGTLLFMLGFSYVVGIVLGYGLIGVFIGMALCYVWWAVVVAIGWRRGSWADRAAEMIETRAEGAE